MKFYLLAGNEDTFGMSGILFKLLIRQLSRLCGLAEELVLVI